MSEFVKTVLASSSPRRNEILKLIGIYPKIVKPNVIEEKSSKESVNGFLKRITFEKTMSINPDLYRNSMIISADTIVLIDNQLVGKPTDRDDAARMIQMLSGREHRVITGVHLTYNKYKIFSITETFVEFVKLSSKEIEYYLNNEEYSDKAGGYAVQGLASVFIKRISGCFFNVMGFPVSDFYSNLGKIGLSLEMLTRQTEPNV